MYTAVQQQLHNGSRAPSSRLCASHGVCVWLVQSSRRLNHDDHIFTSNATTMKHTSSDIIPDKRSIQQKQKSSSPYTSLERLCSPFSTQDAPGISSQPHPHGEPCSLHTSTDVGGGCCAKMLLHAHSTEISLRKYPPSPKNAINKFNHTILCTQRRQ